MPRKVFLEIYQFSLTTIIVTNPQVCERLGQMVLWQICSTQKL